MSEYNRAEECLFTIEKMILLLEQHKEEISAAMQGQICEEYREVTEKEIDKMKELKDKIVRYQYL